MKLLFAVFLFWGALGVAAQPLPGMHQPEQDDPLTCVQEILALFNKMQHTHIENFVGTAAAERGTIADRLSKWRRYLESDNDQAPFSRALLLPGFQAQWETVRKLGYLLAVMPYDEAQKEPSNYFSFSRQARTLNFNVFSIQQDPDLLFLRAVVQIAVTHHLESPAARSKIFRKLESSTWEHVREIAWTRGKDNRLDPTESLLVYVTTGIVANYAHIRAYLKWRGADSFPQIRTESGERMAQLIKDGATVDDIIVERLSSSTELSTGDVKNIIDAIRLSGVLIDWKLTDLCLDDF